MKIHLPLRTLAAGSMLALAIAGVSVGQADAKPKRPLDNGVRCAALEPTTGEWDFYLPGEVVTVIDSQGVGHRFVCGGDGTWVRALRVTPASVLPVGPRPGVLAP